MPPPTPEQVRNRERFEALIKLMAPALDVLLTVGDRVSRIVEREDLGYVPPTGSLEHAGARRVGSGARPPAAE